MEQGRQKRRKKAISPPPPPPPPPPSVQLCAEKVTGGVVAAPTVPLTTTVRALRQRIAEESELPLCDLTLSKDGEALEDGKTLEESGLTAEEGLVKLTVVIDETPKIVVVGGEGRNDEGRFVYHASTELLNPHTLELTPGPTMGTGRSGAAVAQLDKRRALVIGGLGRGYMSLKTTEILDLGRETCVPGPDLTLGVRSGAAAVALDDKRIIVIGGFGVGGYLKTTEIFDPTSNDFSEGPEMEARRSEVTAVKIDDRRILVIGGYNGVLLASTEVLDIDSMKFSRGPTMGTARYGATAVKLADERRVLVIGGEGPNEEGRATALKTTEYLDLERDRFSAGPPMEVARYGAAAVQIDEGHVVVFGGRDESGQDLDSTEVLDLQAGTFSQGPTMGSPRGFAGAVAV